MLPNYQCGKSEWADVKLGLKVFVASLLNGYYSKGRIFADIDSYF